MTKQLFRLILVILIQCYIALCGHIQGWDLDYVYGYDGSIEGYKFYFNLESGLGQDDYIQMIFPRNLGTAIQASVYLYENNLLLAYQRDDEYYFQESPPLQNQYNYYFKIGYELQPNAWYTLVISSIIKPPKTMLYQDPIQILTVSGTCSTGGQCKPIIYDMNHSFVHLYDALPEATPTPIIKLTHQEINSFNLLPGSSYYTYIDITPSTSDPLGAVYYINILKSAANSGLGQNQDFRFKGACYSDVLNCNINSLPGCVSIQQVQNSNCEIEKTFGSLTFRYNEPLIQDKTFRIKVELENPLFLSKRDVSVYAIGGTTKRTIEKGTASNVLETKQINISHGKYSYMWGIPDNQPFLTGDIPFSLFRSGNTVSALNSVQISFLVDQTIPVGEEYIVTICFGEASDILTNSIVTNLPRFDLNKEPKCYSKLTSPTDRCIICESVGALIYTNYEYFIAAKVYYSSSAPLVINKFGSVKVQLANNQAASLYNPFLGDIVNLQQNTEFFDSTGFHSNSFGIGTTQIVSVPDNKSLSGTPDGIQSFLSSTRKNTVGIIPKDVADQQLLFLLKVPQISFTGLSSNPSNSIYNFRMSVMYNPKVILYEPGFEDKGLDFSSFTKGTAPIPDSWSIDSVPCYAANACTWYNSNGPNKPTNVLEKNPATTSAVYNIHRLDCITNNFADCDNWKGYSTASSGTSGIFAMRRIKFRTGFQSQIQPDDDLVDFVVAFQRGLITGSSQVQFTLVSTQLINAYTIQFDPLLNAKISYVNFSDKALNPGHKMPTFLRIGGSIMYQEHMEADAIAVFFDNQIELEWFYDEEGDTGRQLNKQIGCSAGTCQLFDTQTIFGQDTWMNNKMVLVTDLMNIENEFNLIIPVTNSMSGSTVLFPTRLVIAFCKLNKTSLGVRNQLKVLSAFRAFGATTASDITKSIKPINGLNTSLFANALTFNSLTWEASSGIQSKYTLKVVDIKPQGSVDTIFLSDPATTKFPSGKFDPTYKGAGITLCALNFDVFGPSKLGFTTPPYGVNDECTKFSYIFNDNSGTSSYSDFDKKRNYCVFCPIDQTFTNLNTDQGNIIWKNPYFSEQFAAKLRLSTVFTYGFSTSVGKLYSLYSDDQQVDGSFFNSCQISNVMRSVYPNSMGKQAVTFSFKMKAKLQLDQQALIGYGLMKVELTFNQPITQISFTANSCALLSHQITILKCSFTTTANSLVFIIQPVSTYLLELWEDITFQVFAKTNTLPSALSNLKYSISVSLPTSKGGVIRIYGNEITDPTDTYVLFAKCNDGTFPFSSQQYSKFMEINNLQFDVFNVGARSPFNFTFVTQERERFYSTSYFKFDFGFLRAGNINLVEENKLRCVVYEAQSSLISGGTSYGSYKISWKWSRIEYNSMLKDVRIYPKTEFSLPHTFSFILKCYGGNVPAPGATQSAEVLQGYWVDETDEIQSTASKIAYPPQTVISTIDKKRSFIELFAKHWISQGNEAVYTFKITVNSLNLDFFSRIHIEFPYFVPPGINRERNPECYIRTVLVIPNSLPAAADYALAYCEVTGERRVSVWSNKQITQGSVFFVDIFGVSQPSFLRFDTTRPQVWVSFDNDSLIQNGIQEFNFVDDQKPPSPVSIPPNNLQPFQITSASISNTIIRQTYELTITFIQDPNQILPGYSMYALLTQSLSEMTKLGQTNSCVLYNQGDQTTNLAESCTFLSQRLILIKRNQQTPVLSAASSNFILRILDLPSPNYAPPLIKNKIRILLFNSWKLTNTLDQYVDYMGLNYKANIISFNADPNRLNLGWYIYRYSKDIDPQNSNNSIVNETLESNGVAMIYIGYYKKILRLKPENEDTFSLTLGITFTGNIQKFSFNPTTFEAKRGNSFMEFNLAALQTTPTGIEMLQCQKSGDDKNQYTPIPALKVIISGELCQINSRLSTYNIPIGGMSLPIELDFYNCIPVNDILYTPLLTNLNTNQLEIQGDYLVNTVDKIRKDKRMFFVVKEKSNDVTKIGNTIIMNFKIGGTNGPSFLPPIDIKLILVDPKSNNYQLPPVSSKIDNVLVNQNTATLSIQCSQPSIVFWAIGLSPSLTNIDANQIQSKVTGTNGLIANITDSNDTMLRMYGTEVSYIVTPLVKVFEGLKTNGNYEFKYFCLNQMGLQSSLQTTNWKIADNGSFLMKLTYKFAKPITYNQQKQLACAIKSYFSLPQDRVLTDINTKCNELPNYSNLNPDNLNVKNQIDGQYYFYIQPDYLSEKDQTNLSVREKVNQNDFITNFMNTVSGNNGYPTLNYVETDDIVSIDIPEIAQTSQLSVQQTVAYVNFTLRNVNGFIIVGIEEGASRPAPTADQIKQGLNSSGNKLFTFEMRSSQREIQQELKFVQLKPGTEYTAFFIGSNDDPSSTALVTQPIVLSVKTTGQSYGVKTVFGQIIQLSYIAIIIFNAILLLA